MKKYLYYYCISISIQSPAGTTVGFAATGGTSAGSFVKVAVNSTGTGYFLSG